MSKALRQNTFGFISEFKEEMGGFGYVMVAVVSVFISMLAIGMPLDTLTPLPSIVWATAMVLFPFVMLALTFFSEKLAVIKPHVSHSLTRLTERYLELPKEDRKMFPGNILDVINGDLTQDEQRKLEGSMSKIFATIRDRNELRREIGRHPEIIADTLFDLESVNRNIKIEVDTLAEQKKTYELQEPTS